MSAKKVTIDGIEFDSLMEGRRYQQLKLLEQAGVIRDLSWHTEYMLQEACTLSSGKKIRAITWTDDFNYWDNEKECHVVEDVKGHQREANKIRHKMFMKLYDQEVTLIKQA